MKRMRVYDGVEGEGPGIHPLKAAAARGGDTRSGSETAQAKPLLEPPEKIENLTNYFNKEDLSNDKHSCCPLS